MPRSRKQSKPAQNAIDLPGAFMDLPEAIKEMLFESMIDAMKNDDGEGEMSLSLFLKDPQGIVEYDKMTGLRLLYYTIVTRTRWTACNRLCTGKDANATFPFLTTEVPLTTIFTDHGCPTFQTPEGPLERLDIPLLSIAVLNRSAQTLSQIVAHGGQINVRIPQTGQTPLHVFGLTFGMMVEYNHARLFPIAETDETKIRSKFLHQVSMDAIAYAQQLAEAGADITAKDNLGRCPVTSSIAAGQLHIATGIIGAFASITQACREKMDYVSYIRELIDYESKGHNNYHGLGHLLQMTGSHFVEPYRGKRDKLISCYNESGPDRSLTICVRDLVQRAMAKNAHECLAWLLEDFEALELCKMADSNFSLVHCALQSKSLSILKILLDNDADFTQLNEQGASVLACACKDNQEVFVLNFCQVAPPEVMKQLLVQRDETHDITPLGYAVAWGYKSLTNMLLHACRKCALDVNELLQRDLDSSLHHIPCFSAVIHGYPDIVIMLLKDGLDPNGKACIEHLQLSSGRVMGHEAQDTETLSILMCAARYADEPLVKALLDKGAEARWKPAGNMIYTDAVTVALQYSDLEDPYGWEHTDNCSSPRLYGPSTVETDSHEPDPRAATECARESADSASAVSDLAEQVKLVTVEDPRQGSSSQTGHGSGDVASKSPLQLEEAGSCPEAVEPVPTPQRHHEDGPHDRQQGKDAGLHTQKDVRDDDESLPPWTYEPDEDEIMTVKHLLTAGASICKVLKERLTLSLAELAEDGLEVVDQTLNLLQRLKQCSCCAEEGLWKACICRKAWYCGQHCQKKDWANHKKSCSSRAKRR